LDLRITRIAGGIGTHLHEICLADIGTGKDFERGVGAGFDG
jgi:hypothetical protein